MTTTATVMSWDEGVLTWAAALGDPRRNPRVLAALTVYLALRGHATLTAETPETVRIRVTGPNDGLREDELIMKNLLATTAGPDDGITVTDLRRNPAFARAWHHLLDPDRIRQQDRPRRGGAGQHPTQPHDVQFGVRMGIGVAAILAGAVGWPDPVFATVGLVGLLAAVLAPGTHVPVVTGRSLAADLEGIDRSVLSIAASGGQSRVDRAAFERGVPVGVLMGRNLDLWALLADGAYPDGCPWLIAGPELQPDEESGVRAPGPAAMLRTFCVLASQELPPEEPAEPSVPGVTVLPPIGRDPD